MTTATAKHGSKKISICIHDHTACRLADRFFKCDKGSASLIASAAVAGTVSFPLLIVPLFSLLAICSFCGLLFAFRFFVSWSLLQKALTSAPFSWFSTSPHFLALSILSNAVNQLASLPLYALFPTFLFAPFSVFWPQLSTPFSAPLTASL